MKLSIEGSLESKIPEAWQKYGGKWMEFWADFGFWCRSIDTFLAWLIWLVKTAITLIGWLDPHTFQLMATNPDAGMPVFFPTGLLFRQKVAFVFPTGFFHQENCIFCCPLSALCQEAVYWDVGTEFCSKYSQVSCQPLSSNTIFAISKLWDNCRKYISTLESNQWFNLRCYAVTRFRGILLVTHLVFDSFRLVGDSGGN